MTMKVDIKEANQELKDLLSRTSDGTEIIFVENGNPIARLTQLAPRVAGLHRGMTWVSDDFDAELPDEFWFGEK